MIRINLLGEETAADRSTILLMGGYLLSALVFVIICFVLRSSIVAEVEQLSLRHRELESQLATLTVKTKAVQDLEQKRKVLKEKLALIAKLKRSKIGPVRLMDDLNSAVPESVWLRSIAEEGNRLEIKGRALENQDIALFIRNLQRSPYFKEVDLSESRQMLYSKETGKVVPQTNLMSLRQQSPKFGAERRTTKEPASKAGWAVKGAKRQMSRKNDLADQYVRIKEFVLIANVGYYGKLEVVGGQSGMVADKDQGRP